MRLPALCRLSLPVLRVLALMLVALGQPATARAQHPLDGTIWDMVAGAPIDRETLAERLAAADIVILGEVHDNPGHHVAQAWAVGQLRPPGLAFEMIPRASEAGIAALLDQGGDPAEIGPAIGWEQAGWPDWDIYRPIFEAWRASVYTGGALPRRALGRAAAAGAAGVVTDRRFAPSLATPLDPAMQAAVEDEMVAAHCDRLPRDAAPGMVEVQRLRDASFASAALRARAMGGGQVVLITGNGHARTDRGVPLYLREVAPDLAVVAVGMIETEPQAPNLDDYRPLPYDYVWFTAPAERPDPCDAFK